MSMWEIEALVEESIRLVAQTEKKPAEKRALYHNLYHVQGLFDCSFTHFRVMPLLLEAGYAKTMALTDYPNYSVHQVFFEALKEQRFSFIYQAVEQPWSPENPACAYWDKASGKIHYDMESPLWSQLEGTVVPTIQSTPVLAQTIVALAHQAKNKDLVYHWLACAIICQIMSPSQESFEVLQQQFQPINVTFDQYEFDGFEPMHRSLDLNELLGAVEEGYFDEKLNQLILWLVPKS